MVNLLLQLAIISEAAGDDDGDSGCGDCGSRGFDGVDNDAHNHVNDNYDDNIVLQVFPPNPWFLHPGGSVCTKLLPPKHQASSLPSFLTASERAGA